MDLDDFCHEVAVEEVESLEKEGGKEDVEGDE
jgi:hypothetical protein